MAYQKEDENWRCRSSKARGWNGDCGRFSAVLGGDSGRIGRGKPRNDACLERTDFGEVGRLGKEQGNWALVHVTR